MKSIKEKSLSSQTKECILNHIKTLDLSKCNKLPSEENLSKSLGVSRITVRSALNELAFDGIIFRRQGKGTFVNIEALKMKSQLNPIKSFTQIIKENGYNPRINTLGYEVITPGKNVSTLLNITEDDKVVVIDKIFFADDFHCMYCVDYFPLKYLKNSLDLKDITSYDDSIFEFLKNKCDINIVWDKIEIKTTTNIETPKLNTYLNCEDSVKSFLLLEGINFDEHDRPIMYAKEYINTDFIDFNIIRQKLIST